MKKTSKRLMIFAVAFAASLGILYYNDNKDFYDEGENGIYKIATGEMFTFKLRDPGSSMAQVWLNPVQGLELASHTFQPDLLEQGCEGCSGTGIYTFKANNAGSYKILMGLCTPGGEPCDTQKIKPSNIFAITVSD